MGRRRRPHRGGGGGQGGATADRNVLIEGDTGTYAGPQGGAPTRETDASGNLAAREFGVPQADIPGGKKHLVNLPAIPARTVSKPQRPADYHKEHGVETEWGPYEVPPDESGHERRPKPEPEPDYLGAVPVYNVPGPGDEDRIMDFITDGPMFLIAGADPVRLVGRDRHRRKFWIMIENTGNFGTKGIRIGRYEDLSQGRGLYLPGALTSPQDYMTQNDVWVVAAAAEGQALGGNVPISWGVETEIPAATAPSGPKKK